MPFLGKTPSQLVDPEVDIDGGTIDGVSIGSVTADAGAFTNLTATGTLTLPDDGISGDDVNGGTISNFASTGIDDNATSTALTVTDSGIAATLTTAAQPNITSVGTLSALSVTGDLTVDTDTFHVDSTNNWVGIGTATPNRALQVEGDGDSLSSISLNRTGTIAREARIGSNYVGTFSDSDFFVYADSSIAMKVETDGDVRLGHFANSGSSGSLLDLTFVNSNDTEFNAINFQTDNSAGRCFINYERGASSLRGDLIFGTSNASRARIDWEGNVGIGTGSSAIASKLDVVQETNNTDVIRLYNSSGGSGSVQGKTYIGLDHWGMGSTYPSVRIGVEEETVADYDASFVIQTRGSNSDIAPVTRFAVAPSGDVGIGNTNPTGANAGSGYRHLDIKSAAGDTGGSLRLTNSDESSVFRIFNSDTIGTRLGTYSFNTLDIYTDSNFVARFDTSGNFMVNATNLPSVLISATSGDGFGVAGLDGYVVAKRVSNAAAFYANKTGASTSQTTNYIQFRNQGTRTGHVDYDGADVAISQYSDERLKENIQDASSGLAIVNDAQVRSFDWKDGFKKSKRFGFVAQELNQVFPDAVKEGGEDPLEDPWTVNEAKFIPVLVKAIQEQQAIIEDLQTRLSALEAN